MSTRKLYALNLALALLIWAIDTRIPLGVAAGVAYILNVLVALWLPGKRPVYEFAAIGSVLTVAGYFLSDPGGAEWVVFSNRILAVGAIWVTAVLTLERKKQLLAARDHSDELDRMVKKLEAEVRGRKKFEKRLAQKAEDLEAVNVEMEHLLYMVTHDLKTPVVTIRGFLGLLQRDLARGDSEKLEARLERVERSAEHLAELVDDLGRLNRLGASRRKLEKVDVSQLVAELRDDLIESHENPDFTVDVQPDMPPVMTERRGIREAFENLIGNAVKYRREGVAPHVEVGGSAKKGEARFYVRDNGPGIPPDKLSTIFELFVRLDSERDGSGLGLAIVKKAMRYANGRAWVESTVGEGSTFWLAMPQGEVE